MHPPSLFALSEQLDRLSKDGDLPEVFGRHGGVRTSIDDTGATMRGLASRLQRDTTTRRGRQKAAGLAVLRVSGTWPP